MQTLRHLGPSLLLVLMGGCGGGRAPGGGGGDAGGAVDAGVIEGLTPPAPASLAPCPAGWRALALPEGATVCDPWPEAGPSDCGPGEAHFPGGEGCEPVGSPCPAGEFAEDLPAGRAVIHVAGTSGTGGDGSREAPFHDLGAAFAAASGGEIFALGKGSHTIAGIFPESTTFWGACAAETVLVPGFADPATGTVTAIDGARVELRNLRIRGPTPGLRIEGASTVVAEGVIVEDTGIAAAWIFDGSSLEARALVVRDTRGEGGEFGRALSVSVGGHATVERGLFERTREIAVQVLDPGSTIRLVDVAIRGTRPQELDSGFGRAVEVGDGASAELLRVAIESNLDSGLFVGGIGTRATISDSVVRGTRGLATDGTFGRGLHVQNGGTLEATRVWVEDNRELGVYGAGAMGRLVATDLVVRNTRARESDGVGGRGLQVQWGLTLEATRVLSAGNQDYGVFIGTEGTVASLSDLTIRSTRPTESGRFGRGLEVMGGAVASVERAHIEGNHDIGASLEQVGTRVALTDVAIVGTQAEPRDGSAGRGMSIQTSATVTGTRLRILDNHEIGIHVSSSEVTLTDVHVERTAQQPCAATTCPGAGRGVGVTSLGAVVRLTDFRIADNDLAGLFLAAGGTFDLEDGEVTRNPIGIHTGSEAFDFDANVRDVAFVGNDRNVDASVLPLPDASEPGSTDL